MTNGERLRQMTDEELASVIEKHTFACGAYCYAGRLCDEDTSGASCETVILNWLKKESEEE